MELVLDDVQCRPWRAPAVGRRVGAGVAAVGLADTPWSHLRGAGMVEHGRAPCLGEPAPHGGHRATRLAGDDHEPNRQGRGVHGRVDRDLREVERVARGRDEHRRPDPPEQFEPGEAGEPPRRNRECAAGHDRVEGAPEADVGAEGRGDEHAIAAADVPAAEHALPALHPPPPVGRRVPCRQRPAVRPARLVKPHVAIVAPREIAGASIDGGGDQILLRGAGP